MRKPEPEEICGHEILKRRRRTKDKICQTCGMESSDRDDFVRTSCEERLEEIGRQFRQKPVIKGDEQLAYLSRKSDTIHLVDAEKGIGTYNWSECGMGGSLNESIYIHKSELDNDYIIRDGDIVGKLCGNCSTTVSPNKSHFE